MRRKLNLLGKIFAGRRPWLLLGVQGVIVLVALAAAWLLRFEFTWADYRSLMLAAPVLVVSRLISIRLFKLHRGWWQYTGLSETAEIFKSVVVGSLFFFTIMDFLLGAVHFPKSIYVLEAVFSMAGLLSVRVLTRAVAESMREDLESSKRVLILGAGFAGQMVIREIGRQGSGYSPVGLIDDDPTKLGVKVLGVPVLGNVSRIGDLVDRHRVDEVLIAVPSATGAQMSTFVEACELAGVRFRTVPALRDFLMNEATLSQMREVNLDDLLGRKPVQIDFQSVEGQIRGRTILVTGAAGSIGSEICRQVIGFSPAKLICLDSNETGIFYLNLMLSKLKKTDTSELSIVVGDIQDASLVRKVITENGVDVIFHAAAYKHVPVMECNVHTAIKNNVLALLSILDIAQQSGCGSFILISSDKAVNPTSVMGATKRIGELIVASRPRSGMRCVSVRFGNVLGSNGSLIPILQEQLRKGQALTITHPEIKRFFMTTQEAVSLVLQACAVGTDGDVLVLDMGASMKIVDIAHALIRLSGKSVSDVEIVYTGLRDGEKFNEELFYLSEEILPSGFNKIKRTKGRITDWEELKRSLQALRLAVADGTEDQVRSRIKQIVPEYIFTKAAKTPVKAFTQAV